MRRRAASAWVLSLHLMALSACGGGADKPLPEAILGEWEVWCRTEAEATSSCLGKEDSGLYKRFLPDGKLVAGATRGIEMEGTWELAGSVLVLRFEGGGMKIEEKYRARTSGGKLVLWSIGSDFGTILGRKGAAFEAAASKSAAAGGTTKHSIGGVAYTIALPRGYRLARDDNDRQRWEPKHGDGLAVRLTLSPRSQALVDGKWVTPPCEEGGYGGVSGSSQTIDGVERDTSIGTSLCLEDAGKVLMCSGEHTRGWLEPAEKDAALALCKGLSLAAR